MSYTEPHEWWDEYQERMEERYAALIDGKTCLDCGRCVVSERHPDTGYCTEDGEFRYVDDRPEELGLDCFSEAA